MKLSNYFFTTLREDVKDEESISGNLLVRSGMISKIGSGIYSYLPLGLKVLKKIENVVREEMNEAGAIEVLMPSLIPEEYYIESGRRDKFGPSMFTLKDRSDRNYCMGPTHEELFVTMAKLKIKSYKDMPFNIYQMATKYRDEARPRYGLIRVREFVMKDAYSFDKDEEGLDISYEKMRNAYNKIFDRLGIDYKIVKADTGAMGGSLSEEYQAVTDIGEDVLVLCDGCDYASNLEVSSLKLPEIEKESSLDTKLIETPNIKTIDEVSKYLDLPKNKIVKTLIYKINNNLYAVLCSGDREINEHKLGKLFDTEEVELASDSEVKNITGAGIGFIGPLDLELPIVVDEEVLKLSNFAVGANQDNYHYINVNPGDFKYNYVADIKEVKEGDRCPVCGGRLYFKKGIEIGNIFKLGTKYSEAMGLNYLDEFNKLKPVVMGCYGIGIGRILASIAEQNIKDDRIIWPKEIAPFEVAIVPLSVNNDTHMYLANTLYNECLENNIDVLMDDRNERPGVKFNDVELMGIPKVIVIGKKASENIVEYTENGEKTELSVDEVLERIKKR